MNRAIDARHGGFYAAKGVDEGNGCSNVQIVTLHAMSRPKVIHTKSQQKSRAGKQGMWIGWRNTSRVNLGCGFSSITNWMVWGGLPYI